LELNLSISEPKPPANVTNVNNIESLIGGFTFDFGGLGNNLKLRQDVNEINEQLNDVEKFL
jgi:hypothetical protein